MITGSVIEMLPPAPMMSSTTPWNARNAASVVMNDGMPTRATSVPMSRPMTMPVTERREQRDVPGPAVDRQAGGQDGAADART